MAAETLHSRLVELATNYRWTWSAETQALFERLPGTPSIPGQHPLARVYATSPGALAARPELASAIDAAYEALQSELASAPRARRVAYFSPEFALSEALPQYSGGLGVLAGDHLKAASDARVPLVGVGLLYREGFFHQAIEGSRQVEHHTTIPPESLSLADTGVRVRVELNGRSVLVAAWRVDVGTVPLILLDTALPQNPPDLRRVTDRLYGGDREHRLDQEVVLGVGGVRVLHALGIHPDVYHLNEGHSGFLLLELLHDALTYEPSFDDALEAVRARARFTTHTPVPAGIERFDNAMVHRYLGPWARRHGVAEERLLELGRYPDDPEGIFNLAAFCVRMSQQANGVSRLHGEVSRQIFRSMPGGSRITSITNGVHARSWVSPRLQAFLDEHLGEGWARGERSAWDRVGELADATLRAARNDSRARLIEYVERAVPDARGQLDPLALTVGFARRFATYKRATLFMEDAERLERLLSDEQRPLQIIVAGKSHPADEEGKALLARVVEFARSPQSHGRVVFLPDYDMGVARQLVAACDVWLNNPLRPHEACGTSGMKAALNGGLNLSTLDGWWDEAFDGRNGWAIPSSDASDPRARDLEEAASLLDILEREVVPLFYADSASKPSNAWLEKMRHAWRSLGPLVTAARMIEDYQREFYEQQSPSRE